MWGRRAGAASPDTFFPKWPFFVWRLQKMRSQPHNATTRYIPKNDMAAQNCLPDRANAASQFFFAPGRWWPRNSRRNPPRPPGYVPCTSSHHDRPLARADNPSKPCQKSHALSMPSFGRFRALAAVSCLSHRSAWAPPASTTSLPTYTTKPPTFSVPAYRPR